MASTEGVAVEAGPFDLPGRGGAAALCLHGLTGTPYEVRALGEALSAAGVRALGPALPGHCTRPEELVGMGYERWVDAARDHLATLRAGYDTVFVVGLSMGGLLTLLLAAEERVDAAVCIGAPLRLRRTVAALVPFLRHVMPLVPKRGGSDIRDPAARARHPSYDVMPLAAVHQLTKLQRRVREALPRIRAPLLVAHGAHDSTADPADSRRILEAVGSPVRRHLLLADSAHVVPVDRDGPILAAAVVEFLRSEVGAGDQERFTNVV